MLYFLFLTLLLLILFICAGWAGKLKKSEFMSYDFTNAIKGFAILTVIWAHSGARLNIGGIQFIAGIGVALFLICSGYGLEKSFNKNGIDGFFEKRLLRVCIPYWIITTLGDFIMPDRSMRVYLEKMIFVKAGWYIKYILVCYFIFYIVKKVKKTVKKNLIKSGTAVSTVFEHELTQDIIDTLKSKRKAKLSEIKAGESSSQTAEGFQKNTSTPAPQTTYNPFAQ